MDKVLKLKNFRQYMENIFIKWSRDISQMNCGTVIPLCYITRSSLINKCIEKSPIMHTTVMFLS